MSPETASSAPAALAASEALPSVTVVLVNFNGRDHLVDCLDSIAALDYPVGRVETVLVDNASADGSLELVAQRYPWVRVVPQIENLGFAGGVNVGVTAASTDCVALVNNDMRVDPSWLRELVSKFDPASGYVCVAGLILDWEGRRVDFADAIVNLHGFGHQPGFRMPVEEVHIEDGSDLPMACGGSLLVDRQVFLDVGGLDPAYFAYFEDVDFGWRLWLMGYRIRLAAGARAYHRHHGTSGGLPGYQVTLLMERNALRTLVKNLDGDNLGRVLSASLLLLSERARLDARTQRGDFDVGARPQPHDTSVPRVALARLEAVGDIVGSLPELMEQRRRVQTRRRRTDADVFRQFGRPFEPLGRDDEPYLEAMTAVTQALRLDEVFTQARAGRVLVLAYDPVGERMAGPGVRSWEISRALARSVPVTLASNRPIGRSASGVETVAFDDPAELRSLVQEADVVLVHGHALQHFPFLRGCDAVFVVDLYDPWIFENLAQQAAVDGGADAAIWRDVDVQADLLDAGDFFVCASERQRDYWLGMLTARGRVERAAYGADPTLRDLIDVLPYGCPDEGPRSDAPVLKGVHPRIAADDLVILWGGGTWDWFDPLLVLEAFVEVLRAEPRARLYFMGLELGGRGVPEMATVRRLRDRAEALGLAGKQVIFGDWVPYDDRGGFLLEADVGVLATHDLAEVRLAFRSRMLDHFWAGLPTVTTEGDFLAGVVRERGAGIVVPMGDARAMSDALLRLLRDADLRSACGKEALDLADEYRWSQAVEPLRRVVEEPWRWRGLRSFRARPVALTEDARRLLELRRHQVERVRRWGLALRRAKNRVSLSPAGPALRRVLVWWRRLGERRP